MITKVTKVTLTERKFLIKWEIIFMKRKCDFRNFTHSNSTFNNTFFLRYPCPSYNFPRKYQNIENVRMFKFILNKESIRWDKML